MRRNRLASLFFFTLGLLLPCVKSQGAGRV